MTNSTTTTNQESTTKSAQEFLAALEGALVETLEDKGYSEEEVQEYLSDDELEALMFGDEDDDDV